MEAHKNRFIEDWGTARENLEHNFRWTRRNFAIVGLFGIAIPLLVYKGIVREFVISFLSIFFFLYYFRSFCFVIRWRPSTACVSIWGEIFLFRVSIFSPVFATLDSFGIEAVGPNFLDWPWWSSNWLISFYVIRLFIGPGIHVFCLLLLVMILKPGWRIQVSFIPFVNIG